MSTGSDYLIEFSRSAKRNPSYWAGLCQDGILYGHNTMGNYIMTIREILNKDFFISI